MIRFIPRETKFFELLAELSSAMNEGARLLRGILEDPHDLEARVEQMQAIEHRGDKAIHAIMTKLNQTFITPFDREDIHHLASSLDDVLDYMNTAATRPRRRRRSWRESSCCRAKSWRAAFRCWRKMAR